MEKTISDTELELFVDCLNLCKEIQPENSPIKVFHQFSSKSSTSNSDHDLIPKFYDKAFSDPAQILQNETSLKHKLREEARSTFLQKKSGELLDNQELKIIWDELEKLAVFSTLSSTPISEISDEKFIDYRSFKNIGLKMSTKAQEFFTAASFAKFIRHGDLKQRIPINLFFNYVMRKTWLRQSRIGLSLYDLTGNGYLTEKDLELYITELMPTVPNLRKLDESFQSFYICTAVRRFLFFLDPKRLGKVRIVDILASGFLDDLLELRDSELVSSSPEKSSEDNTVISTQNDQFGAKLANLNNKLDKNWFSVTNALRVYGQYLNLDSDRNGMLSVEELRHYGSGNLTQTFVERVFQECLTYDGEMDYKAFLDFVLAMENKSDPSSLQYFFRILDVKQAGYLDAFAINYFFRSIQKMLDEQEQPMVSLWDVKDEMFDMVKPKSAHKISLQDLIDSGQGETVVSILTDLNGFWTYENREYLATDPQKDEDSELI